ncbi:MAG TPA: ATP-dependent sacrificial sulfur transferase LarE [Candidatus Polarisedimenticolia bacterium]
MEQEYVTLRGILDNIGSCLVAFSGGVDSTFLLKVACDRLGDRVTAITAVSPSLAREEREQAVALAMRLGVAHRLIPTGEIDNPAYVRNDASRCYYCKKDLFEMMARIASMSGGRTVIYGAIMDDLGEDRPGMKAAREAGVRAPLIEAGLGKAAIRDLSRRLGLPTWDKPAMPCLASRLPRGTAVTVERLALVEQAEAAVRALGYKTVRVRYAGDDARVELDPEGLRRVDDPAIRTLLVEAVRGAGFRQVVVDPRGYRPGGAADAAGAVGH